MKKRNTRRGATIMEVLVTLTIIVLLASVVGPRVFRYLGTAKSETASLQVKNVSSAVRLFYIDVGRYPTQAEGLQALLAVPPGVSDWNGPYLESPDGLKDPWNRDILYVIPGQNKDFAVQSLGRDGARGGSGEDADITH